MRKEILKRPSISSTKYPNLKSLLNAVRSLSRATRNIYLEFRSVLTNRTIIISRVIRMLKNNISAIK